MPKFAANLTMLYTDSPFLERFERAKASGFHFIEYLFPYEHDLAALTRALEKNALTQVLFNLPAGNWGAGERGIAALPDRIAEFQQSVARALEVARVLKVKQLNCLVGKRDEKIPREDQTRVMIENLRYAAHALGEQGILLVIEMLNPFDVPNFMLASPRAAFEAQDAVASPNLKIQYDVYHAQRAEGELANTFQKNLARIAHVQIADNPGRHQPGTGEINYRYLFNFMDQVGYTGYVGLEYIPDGTTEQSLNWVNEYGYSL
ncbi:MAG: hydroxypyruvate isomerase [Chloroflexi bacterium]|nr:hydroxypyruvate isomerase [Chloroflexota bacterium]